MLINQGMQNISKIVKINNQDIEIIKKRSQTHYINRENDLMY